MTKKVILLSILCFGLNSIQAQVLPNVDLQITGPLTTCKTGAHPTDTVYAGQFAGITLNYNSINPDSLSSYYVQLTADCLNPFPNQVRIGIGVWQPGNGNPVIFSSPQFSPFSGVNSLGIGSPLPQTQFQVYLLNWNGVDTLHMRIQAIVSRGAQKTVTDEIYFDIFPICPIVETAEGVTSEPLKIFPNPANHLITISGAEDLVEILNYNGAPVKTFTAQSGILTLNIADLTPGHYAVKNGKQTLQFIKME